MNYEAMENLKKHKIYEINLDDLKDYSSFLLKKDSILY